MSSGLNWLTACPVAHRGLHDDASGVIENSRTAIINAMEHGFHIEIDIGKTSDNKAIVYHDAKLERLTDRHEPVADLSLAELQKVPFSGTNDTLPGLDEVLKLIDNQVGLIIEIKSDFSDNLSWLETITKVVRKAHGRIALKSFDREMMRQIKKMLPETPCGIVVSKHYPHQILSQFSYGQALAYGYFLPERFFRPDFITLDVQYLPGMESVSQPASVRHKFLLPGFSMAHVAKLCHKWNIPSLGWTVRNQNTANLALQHVNQIIFEHFLPENPCIQKK